VRTPGQLAGGVSPLLMPRALNGSGVLYRPPDETSSDEWRGYIDGMTDRIKPDPTDPADPGTDEAPKPASDGSRRPTVPAPPD
jgi:hypothetical protein